MTEDKDRIIIEMQEQLKQLKEKLEGQKIIDERLLRNAYRSNLSSLQKKARSEVALAVVAMVLCGSSFTLLDFPAAFIICTELMLLAALVATLVIVRWLPQMDSDLLTASEGIARFRMAYVNWIKYSIPVLILWIAYLVYVVLNLEILPMELKYSFFGGGAIGLVIGLILGLKQRREIISRSEELLEQIKDLRG